MIRFRKILLMLISMTVIMLLAVGIDLLYRTFGDSRLREERYERYTEVQTQVSELEVMISELSGDEEAIHTFLTEHSDMPEGTVDAVFPEEASPDSVYADNDVASGQTGSSETFVSDNHISDRWAADEVVPGHSVSGNLPGETGVSDSSVSANLLGDVSVSDNSVSGNLLGDISVSDNSVSDNLPGDISVSDNSVSGNQLGETGVSDNRISDDSLSGNFLNYVDLLPEGMSENRLVGEYMPEEQRIAEILDRRRSGQLTLSERRKLQGSYMETIQTNQLDRAIIKQNQIDFSDIKIACLGDSITAASNLEGIQDYEQYSYPSILGNLLGTEQVTNLGIGGSSIGRYWDDAFVDRYREIPEDTDIILVMGGTNDGFCVTGEDMGNLEERRYNTFVGDLDELMRGLKEEYSEALIVFVTPLPNILHDILRMERPDLLPQEELAAVIKRLGDEYRIPVIDLYNSNLLDSHDAANIYNYLPDGVHCNPEGYQILAEHMAAEVIEIYAAYEG